MKGLSGRPIKAVRQSDQNEVLPLSGMARDVALSMRVLHKHVSAGRNGSDFAVARLELDNTIEPDRENSSGRCVPSRYGRTGRNVDEADA